MIAAGPKGDRRSTQTGIPMNRFHAASIAALAGMFLALPGARAEVPRPIDEVLDIAYCQPDGDTPPERCQLDVFRPKEASGCPVLFLVHGGAWLHGSKKDLRIRGINMVYSYRDVGRFFAEQGLVVVIPNYRLSPAVKHPEHVRDVARALAWTCKNVNQHGGDPARIFLAGHSAGGHLVSLLATDETYLKEVGLDRAAVKGIISVSGVYRPSDFLVRTVVDLFDGRYKFAVGAAPLARVFGTEREVYEQAGPLTHVKPGLPPFLIVYAVGLGELPRLGAQAKAFHAALQANHCESELLPAPLFRDHATAFFGATNRNDPVARAMLGFIRKHGAGAAVATP